MALDAEKLFFLYFSSEILYKNSKINEYKSVIGPYSPKIRLVG